MPLSLSTTHNSLIFVNTFKTIELVKNSITYQISYENEIIEISGLTVEYEEEEFFLYGKLSYSGISSFSGLTDPNSLPSTSQNFQELVLFVKDFVDVSDPTGQEIESLLDAHLGSDSWRTPETGESIESALDTYLGTDWKTGGPGTAWGTVGGTLSNQTDLQTALDAKTDISTFNGEFSVTPVGVGTFRVRSQSVFPGWANTTVAGGSTAYEPIDVEPETAYTFEDCTHTFSGTNDFIFLNKAGFAISRYEGIASDNIITPRDCAQVVFSTKDSDTGAGFLFKKLPNVEVDTTTRTGANLYDGVYYLNWVVNEIGGQLGFIAQTGAMSASIPVREGATYYLYRENYPANGIVDIAVGLDDNDNCVTMLSSDFSGYDSNHYYAPFTIPEGQGITKIMLILAEAIGKQEDLVNGDIDFALVEEANYRISEDFKSPGRNKSFNQAVNEIVDLRSAINKVFLDKNLMIMGDSVYATQTDAADAYFVNDTVTPNNQGTNKLYGGACSEIVRRLRPKTWTNYSNGGWTLTYTGADFGQDIYDNGGTGSYLYNLERFFVDYDAYVADPVTNAANPRYTPDVFMVASCINDFTNPTEAWVTDAEVSASGKSYDQYMEDTFISSGISNDTLIPLEDVDLTKVAGSLRYVIERVYRKFPECYIAVVTSNKTSNHPRENQYKCTRDMIWIAERLNVQVIDVFNNGNQMIPLKEFKDSVTGTRDELYLSSDGIHHYGSVGRGDQRMGRFITNELIKGYFGLDEFLR